MQTWSQPQFVGQRSFGNASAEARLIAYDLDVRMGQPREMQHDLRPRVAELEKTEGRGARGYAGG